MKFYFVNTCYACPEQYDVYRDNGQICAYVRLRWGNLYAEYPSIDGEVIYNTHFSDNSKGNFDNDSERDYYLKEISGLEEDRIYGNPVEIIALASGQDRDRDLMRFRSCQYEHDIGRRFFQCFQ